MRYVPRGTDLPNELDNLRRFTDQPLFPSIQLEKLITVPTNPPDGMVIYADVDVIAPFVPEGFYGYYGGSWVLLG